MQKLDCVRDYELGESIIPDLAKKYVEDGSHPSNSRKEDQHVMDWRGFFSASSDQVLKLCSLQHQNGKVVIPEKVIDEGISQ